MGDIASQRCPHCGGGRYEPSQPAPGIVAWKCLDCGAGRFSVEATTPPPFQAVNRPPPAWLPPAPPGGKWVCFGPPLPRLEKP